MGKYPCGHIQWDPVHIKIVRFFFWLFIPPHLWPQKLSVYPNYRSPWSTSPNMGCQICFSFLQKFPKRIQLLGGLEHDWIMTFHSVGNFIIPTDEVIFFGGVEATNQLPISDISILNVQAYAISGS